jgi:TRAP-type C4-dicarboxylate transport system permease small subunit
MKETASEYQGSLGTAKRMADSVSRWLAVGGMWLILVMGVMLVADIILRALGHPLIGTSEITELLLSVSIFTTLAYTWMSDRHVRITMFLAHLGPKPQAGLDAFASLLGAALFALIAWKNMSMAIDSFRLNDITWLARVPIYPVYVFVFLGSALLTIQMLITCGLSVGKLVKTDKPAA